MRSLPGTSSSNEIRKSIYDSRLTLFAVLLTLGMTLILSINVGSTASLNVEPGQAATSDVFAPFSLTYTSDVLTNRAREQAGNNVSDVYSTQDLSIGRSQLAEANAIFNFIDTVRADNQARLDEKVGYLQAVEGVTIDESVASDLLTMSQSDYETARTEILRIIDDLMREEIRENNVEEFQRLARRQASLGLTPAQSNAVTSLGWQFIVPTVFLDNEATSAAREVAASDIEPATRSIVKDQRIIRAGELVTEADMELLTQVGLLTQESNWTYWVSMFLASLLSVTLITLYWRWFIDKLHDSGRYLILLAGLLLFFTVIAKGMNAADLTVLPYVFPITVLSLIVAVLFDVRFSILITVIIAGILGLTTPNSLEMTLYAAAGGLLAILTLRDAQRIVAIFQAGLMAAVGHIAIMWMFGLQAESDFVLLLQQSLYGLGNGVLSAALTLAGFYLLGSLFGVITTVQLQDLSRLDHPLLQELLRRAPGTYHHSIMVANLAEQAAERVKANSTLVRVGAFYHDIGKMNRPPFFTENQEGVNPHDALDPYTSAQIIISHVSDGLELAGRYHLPDRIRDFIAEHHGTRMVKAFYHKACAEVDDEAEEVDENLFRYVGPRPRSRESGIVMMADAIEATSSALRPDTPAAIEKLVNSLVDGDIMEAQLNDSGLTMGDIEKIRHSFIETLKGRFHVRVRYPGNEKLETGKAPQVALPEVVGSTEPVETAVAPAPLPVPSKPTEKPRLRQPHDFSG